MRIKRALTVSDLRLYNAHTLAFEGRWLESFGKPEITGSWIIWGNPANGKTRLALQMARYLGQFVKVAYNSLEEGLSLSMREAVISSGMEDISGNFILLDKEPVNELIARLRRQRSPEVVIIDSWQYTGLNYAAYKVLRDEFRNKLFILISHADGKNPKGQVANSIRYDAFVKVYVEGYKAFPQSRYGGGEEFVIWEKGASDYWNFK